MRHGGAVDRLPPTTTDFLTSVGGACLVSEKANRGFLSRKALRKYGRSTRRRTATETMVTGTSSCCGRFFIYKKKTTLPLLSS